MSALAAGELIFAGGGGDKLRLQMLRVTRSFFRVATIALVGIATTIAATYLIYERNSTAIDETREIARIGRSAYSAAMELELALHYDRDRWDSSANPEVRDASQRLGILLNTLSDAALKNKRHTTSIRAIMSARKAWNQALAKRHIAANEPLELAAFQSFRATIATFIKNEDEEYMERRRFQATTRLLMSGAVLLEIILLLLIINGMQKRLFAQASEMLRDKESLEQQAKRMMKQTEALELSNRELAAAIEEKEIARALAEEQAAESNALFTAITEVFFVIDSSGRYQKVAPTNDRLLAASREELLGKTVQEILPEPVASFAMTKIAEALETGERTEVEYPLQLCGKTVWFSGTVTPFMEKRVLWVVRDVSETKEAAEALKESEARFRHLVEQSPQAIVLHVDGRVMYANPTCATMLGFAEPEMVIGAPLFRFVTIDSAPRLMESLGSLGRSTSRALTCECQFKRVNDSRLLQVEVTSVPVTHDGRAGVISILHDVTERKQLEDQLAHQAFHDPLTNLANRVLFRDRVEHSIQRSSGAASVPSVLLIDLDNFKAVNDGLGHSAGDWLLIEVADRLLACLRPADTVARLGGDEFAVLIDDQCDDAGAVADCILEAFRVPFAVHGTDIVVTMSIGIAPVLQHQGADEVLRNADLALYRAKAEGKACAASFEPEMHVAALRRLEIEAELRRAINGEKGAGELVLYYQPIARLSTGKMFGFEALVRWRHPERGMIEPHDFIALAEETGLIVPLGRWVLRNAATQARQWQMRFGPLLRGSGVLLSVAVNLSGRDLAQPELVHDVAETLRGSGLAASDLVLEMTESMLVHDNRATLERLHNLKSLGVKLSIDDFGTGYSSLAYLERFPVDTLKMDKSFIEGLGVDQTTSPLAEAVIGLGRILGLRVVAEGIETQGQWERLRELGCALGQGYHISPPVSVPEFERLLMASVSSMKGLSSGRFVLGGPSPLASPVSALRAIG